MSYFFCYNACFFFIVILFIMSNEIEEKLKQIRIEDFIWVIYIGIIALSYYSNYLEREYYIFNDLESKDKYRNIIILIFSILLIVYFYFLYDAYKSVDDLKCSDSEKKKRLVYLSFLASLLIFISGAIFLYIAISDTDLNVELAFN